jgi:hypothetical protein
MEYTLTELTLDDRGNASGLRIIRKTGDAALEGRAELTSPALFEQDVRSWWQMKFGGADISGFQVSEARPGHGLHYQYRIILPGLAQQKDDRLYLPLTLYRTTTLQSHAPWVFRDTDLPLHTPWRYDFVSRIRIPAGFTAAALPAPQTMHVDRCFWQRSVKLDSAGVLEIRYRFELEPGSVRPAPMPLSAGCWRPWLWQNRTPSKSGEPAVNKVIRTGIPVPAILAALLSAVSLCPAKAAPPHPAGRYTALDDALHTGRAPQMYTALADLLRYHPHSAENAALLNDYFRLGKICAPEECLRLGNALLAANPAGENALNNALRFEMLNRLNRARFALGDADSTSLAREYPKVAGLRISPVTGRLGAADFDLPPDPDFTLHTISGWRPAVADVMGFTRPAEQSWPQSGTVHLAAGLAGERPFLLRVECNRDYTLFINGREVLRNVRRSPGAARVRWVRFDTAGPVCWCCGCG